MTAGQAIEQLRCAQKPLDSQIVYLYVLDDQQRLIGVVPVRRLLSACPDKAIQDIMVRQVVCVPHDATMSQAAMLLLEHKLLAVPVVDEQHRLIGVVDLGHFTQDVMDRLAMTQRPNADRFFQLLGIHIRLGRHISARHQFADRFPWLLCNIVSGLLCALIAALFSGRIEQLALLTMFITVVLALAESVSMQAMTLALQMLDLGPFRWSLVGKYLTQELAAGLLLGIGCGVSVGAISWLLKGNLPASIAIGLSIIAAILTACALGVAIPSFIRAVRLDPKIAAGPIVLASADVATLLFYFTLMMVLVG